MGKSSTLNVGAGAFVLLGFAALAFLTTLRKLLPEFINLCLRLAANKQRGSFIKRKGWTTIKGDQLLPIKPEAHAARRAGNNGGVLKNRGVKIHRLFGVTVKPQKWGNGWHLGVLLFQGYNAVLA